MHSRGVEQKYPSNPAENLQFYNNPSIGSQEYRRAAILRQTLLLGSEV